MPDGICKLCGSAYARESATPGLCWPCARPTHPGAPPVASALLPDLPALADDAKHVCRRCNQRYAKAFPGEACWECESGDRQAAQLRARRRQGCGVSRRHSAFLGWADLHGPRDYLKAVAAVREFAERGTSILALVGRRGSGKTQLAAIAVWQRIEAGRLAKITTALMLLMDLKRRFDDRGDAEGAWCAEWVEPHLLVIDEVGELVAGDYNRAMFAALVDRRYEACRPTLLIGNLTVEQYAGCVGASVASRTTEGDLAGIIVCDWPSFRRTDESVSANARVPGLVPDSGRGGRLAGKPQKGHVRDAR